MGPWGVWAGTLACLVRVLCAVGPRSSMSKLGLTCQLTTGQCVVVQSVVVGHIGMHCVQRTRLGQTGMFQSGGGDKTHEARTTSGKCRQHSAGDDYPPGHPVRRFRSRTRSLIGWFCRAATVKVQVGAMQKRFVQSERRKREKGDCSPPARIALETGPRIRVRVWRSISLFFWLLLWVLCAGCLEGGRVHPFPSKTRTHSNSVRKPKR